MKIKMDGMSIPDWSYRNLSGYRRAYSGLKDEIQHLKQEFAKMQVKEDKVDELKVWKEKIDDVCSPTQLKELVAEVEELKTFKTKAITIFAAVQVAMGLFAWALKFFE